MAKNTVTKFKSKMVETGSLMLKHEPSFIPWQIGAIPFFRERELFRACMGVSQLCLSKRYASQLCQSCPEIPLLPAFR